MRSAREYLEKDEREVPLPQDHSHQDRDTFTFYGHRLSSLYRRARKPHKD